MGTKNNNFKITSFSLGKHQVKVQKDSVYSAVTQEQERSSTLDTTTTKCLMPLLMEAQE